MYHYTDSGLENVWLVNGYEVLETEYGEAVAIHDLEGLHLVIGAGLIDLPRRLEGSEVRFLRKELGLSQKLLAQFLDMDEQSIARWEAGKFDISGPADRLLRVIYSEHCDSNPKVVDFVRRLSELDQIASGELRFKDTEDGWRTAA